MSGFFKCRGCGYVLEYRVLFWMHKFVAYLSEEDYDCRHAGYEKVPQYQSEIEFIK